MGRVMADGCDYQGYEFGANYLDSVCINGYLWDADSGEMGPDGWLYDSGGEIPCPQCNHDSWLLRTGESILESGHLAGYDGKPISECPFPRKGDEYHKRGDAQVFRYCWLKGYWDGAAEKRKETTDHDGHDSQ